MHRNLQQRHPGAYVDKMFREGLIKQANTYVVLKLHIFFRGMDGIMLHKAVELHLIVPFKSFFEKNNLKKSHIYC